MTEADNGKTVEIAVGDSVELSLPENASTGYRWAIESVDNKVVAAHDAKYTEPTGGVGSGDVGVGLRRDTRGVDRADRADRVEGVPVVWRDLQRDLPLRLLESELDRANDLGFAA